MKRVYSSIIENHLEHYNEMVFLAGPRQVGKTTIAKQFGTKGNMTYLNWDVHEHQRGILAGPQTLGEELGLMQAHKIKPLVIFDEIHKFPKWKTYLKGFFDLYNQHAKIIVTGSAKLDIYQRGGDSMMGRYFLYHINPLSVAEIIRTTHSKTDVSPPKKISDAAFNHLWNYGGFPQPYLKHEKSYFLNWKKLRNKQLFQEDIRDITQIHHAAQLELLANLIHHQTGQLLNRNNLAGKVQVSIPTISKWLEVLNRIYYCFSITPYQKNVTRSLIKEPKPYLHDWSLISDKGAKAENFIACHLLKAIQFWNDTGHGEYSLHFIRDKDKNEVDFAVIKNGDPWILVEVKLSNNKRISPQLEKFQKQTGAKHAFQVVLDLPYEDVDCFKYTKPTIVPAKTFLSQLV